MPAAVLMILGVVPAPFVSYDKFKLLHFISLWLGGTLGNFLVALCRSSRGTDSEIRLKTTTQVGIHRCPHPYVRPCDQLPNHRLHFCGRRERSCHAGFHCPEGLHQGQSNKKEMHWPEISKS